MNSLAVFSLLEATLRAAQELNALLTKAQMENRDITDEEIKALAVGNDVFSAELIKKLRS